jgi:hypothetical protein
MKRLLSISLAVLTGLCMVVATERRAWGYIDPGSGLVALQTIASVAAAGTYFMRRKLQGLFGSKKVLAPEVATVGTRKAGDSRSAA